MSSVSSKPVSKERQALHDAGYDYWVKQSALASEHIAYLQQLAKQEEKKKNDACNAIQVIMPLIQACIASGGPVGASFSNIDGMVRYDLTKLINPDVKPPQ